MIDPRRIRRVIDGMLSRVVIVLMAALVIDVLWQVVARYLLHSPSSYTDELARYLLIWVALLGAALMTGRRGHLAIDLLPSHLAPVPRHYLEILIDSLILLFALFVLLIGGARLVFITLTLEQISPALRVPLGYVYLVIPLSGVLVMLYSLLNIFDRRRPDLDRQLQQ